MKTTTIFAIALTAFASLSIANAALINVNYNSATDTPPESTLSGPAGGLATTWNSSTTANTGVLNDSTGATTSVSISTTGYDSEPTLNVITAGILPVFRSFLDSFPRPSSYSVTINGLDSGGVYDIWLLSFRDNNATTERSVGTWSTANTTTSSSSQLVDAQLATPGPTIFSEGYNYVLFSDVEATAGGVISFTGQSAGFDEPQDADSRRLHLNGLQIQQVVPEPSTAILAGLGLAGLCLRRRRR